MSRAIPSRSLAALAVALAGPAHAAGVAFVHEASIYIDAKERALSAPEGVACSASGHVVVADTGNRRLVLYTYKDGRLGGGTEVRLEQLPSPFRVQIDARGDVLVLDLKTRKIARVAANGSFGGALEPQGLSGNVVLGAFKLGPGGEVVLLDVAGRRVAVADASGKVTREVPLPPGSVVTDVAADATGSLYAVDAVGAVVWVAEKGAAAFRALTKGMKDRMSFPVYLAVDRGRIFLVDQYGSGVVVLGIDGSYQGRQLSIGWNDGLVNYPAQLCLRDDGVAFVADRFNDRVQAFSIGR
ncbi:MAG TPA: hypothetical protein VLS93_16170 [Anaeromyxobacteraceae bacterium]|nr:hypothetical protein [Anaeromyxobacteraceae bacterium]